jgi:hypothetical protein
MSRFWNQWFGKKSTPPWAEARPIFSALKEWNGDSSFELPDEPEASQTKIRFAGGALDGIFSHHIESSGDDKRNDILDRIMFALHRLAATNSDEARAAIYNIFMGESALANADALAERLTSQHKLGRDDIRPHARWLVHHAAHREPLKLGIVLLGLSGTEDDIADLKVLARHDEFTLYAAVAAGNIVADPTDIWWAMASNVHGWGKIHLVERLGERASGRPDLQAWLLRHGCENEIMDEYLAFTCASAGDLAGTVASETIDDELIDGACRILGALLAGGPAEDIEGYPQGVFAMKHLVRHLITECNSLARLHFVWSVRRWLEWPPAVEKDIRQAIDHTGSGEAESAQDVWERRKKQGWTEAVRTELARTCDRILRRPEWPERVRAVYITGSYQEQNEAWSLAEAVGIDLWEDAFARLERERLNSTLYFQLMRSDDLHRVHRVIEFAERHLPLASIATGPKDYFGFGPEYEAHSCLDYLLQEMRRECVFSDTLIAAGLRSPVTRNRNMAAAALEAHPVSAWGERTREALGKTVSDECNKELRERLRGLVNTPPPKGGGIRVTD